MYFDFCIDIFDMLKYIYIYVIYTYIVCVHVEISEWIRLSSANTMPFWDSGRTILLNAMVRLKFDACGISVPLHVRLRTANHGVFGLSAFHESLFNIGPNVAIRNLLTVAVVVTWFGKVPPKTGFLTSKQQKHISCGNALEFSNLAIQIPNLSELYWMNSNNHSATFLLLFRSFCWLLEPKCPQGW